MSNKHFHLRLTRVTVAPPGNRIEPEQFGFSDVNVQFRDNITNTWIDVKVAVPTKYSASDTFGDVRAKTLERAKVLLKEALTALDEDKGDDVRNPVL